MCDGVQAERLRHAEELASRWRTRTERGRSLSTKLEGTWQERDEATVLVRVSAIVVRCVASLFFRHSHSASSEPCIFSSADGGCLSCLRIDSRTVSTSRHSSQP